MQGKGVRLLLREDVQVIMVLRGDLWEHKGIRGETGVGGRRGEGREVAARKEGRGEERGGEERGGGGGGGVMQVEEQKGEAKVREPRDQSMQGLCRDSQGNPSTIWK